MCISQDIATIYIVEIVAILAFEEFMADENQLFPSYHSFASIFLYIDFSLNFFAFESSKIFFVSLFVKKIV
jgi:hypothetical protein